MKLNRGITLIALVITVIILLILAGITIGTLGGENGLISKTKTAEEKHIKAEMEEKLNLSIQELQIKKQGNASLQDLIDNQEILKNNLEGYKYSLGTIEVGTDGKN